MLCFGAVFLPRAAAADGHITEGERFYRQKCQICHGVKGNGKGPARAAFYPHPTNFTTPEFWEREDINKFIATTVREGYASMPAFSLSSEEIQAIIDYMSHTFKPQTKYQGIEGDTNIMKTTKTRLVILICALGVYSLICTESASAVPSFARQTGMSCTMCHTVWPQLTHFGRTFKLDGYTFSKESESERWHPPVAGMFGSLVHSPQQK